MPEINFELTSQQGPLKEGFKINLKGNYVVLIGPNNVAKTSILQAIFRTQVPQNTLPEKSEICFILPERIFVEKDTQTGSQKLEQYNQTLVSVMIGTNKSYQGLTGPASAQLPKLLLNHSDFIAQLNKLEEFFRYFGFPDLVLGRGTQEITFDQVEVAVQGSGLRSIFAILAALTDDAIKLLLIDEPELSLEAGLQKRLRDLLYEASKGKQIVIATHSHLFLNRDAITSNYTVKKENGEVIISSVASEEQLYEITFDMLGSSTEDLFFPRNFLIVEGASDQTIVNKVMQLKGIDKAKIKVISASGVGNVDSIMSAIYNTLLPLVLTESPYKQTVVALIDKPQNTKAPTYKKIKKNLADRLLELTSFSLEEYMPEDLYVRCNRIKDDDLREIQRLKKNGDYFSVGTLKGEIANAISGVLTLEDLANIQIIADAVDKANT